MAPPDQPGPGELELVVTFVNTRIVDHDVDALTTADDLTHWLHHTGLLPDGESAQAADVPRVQAVREALRGAMAANVSDSPVPDASLQVLNAAARRARVTPVITADGGAEFQPMVGGVPGAIGALVALVLRAMNDGDWTRLKVCADEACQGAFYDGSRARTARWDSMSVCGNRAKQRAWRERRS